MGAVGVGVGDAPSVGTARWCWTIEVPTVAVEPAREQGFFGLLRQPSNVALTSDVGFTSHVEFPRVVG